jgi:hypothetical protein
MALGGQKKGFLALPRSWMAVAQVRASLAQDEPAQLSALPAVAHKPQRVISRRVAEAAEKTKREFLSAHSAFSAREILSPLLFHCHFPVFSLIVDRKPLPISSLQIPPLRMNHLPSVKSAKSVVKIPKKVR